MKRLMTVLAGLTLFSVSLSAEPNDGMMQGQMPHKAMKMDQCCSMPQKCTMKGDQPMPMAMKSPMHDMMHSMVDIMKMQQKIIKGVKPSEKKALLIQIDKKIDQMENMKADMPCMQNPPSGHDHEHDHEAMGK